MLARLRSNAATKVSYGRVARVLCERGYDEINDELNLNITGPA